MSVEMNIHFSARDDDRQLTFPTNSFPFLSCSVNVWPPLSIFFLVLFNYFIQYIFLKIIIIIIIIIKFTPITIPSPPPFCFCLLFLFLIFCLRNSFLHSLSSLLSLQSRFFVLPLTANHDSALFFVSLLLALLLCRWWSGS